MKKIGIILLYSTLIFSLVGGFFYLMAKHPDAVGVGIIIGAVAILCMAGGRAIYEKLHR